VKVNLSGSGVLALAGVVVLVGVVGYVVYKIAPGVRKVFTKTLNPASSENIVNQGVTAAVSSAVGYQETLGGYIADKVFALRHPDFQMSGPTATKVKPVAVPEPGSAGYIGPPKDLPVGGSVGDPNSGYTDDESLQNAIVIY